MALYCENEEVAGLFLSLSRRGLVQVGLYLLDLRTVGDGVVRLTGREPVPVDDYVRANAAEFLA